MAGLAQLNPGPGLASLTNEESSKQHGEEKKAVISDSNI